MTPFKADFVRVSGTGEEAILFMQELSADTVFDAQREVLGMQDEHGSPLVSVADAVFLYREGPRVRRYGRNADGITRWGRA